MKSLAKSIANLPWLILLLLVIFFDGLVGAVVRLGNGKALLTKIVGVALLVSFILSIVSFLGLPPFIGWIVRVIYVICWVCDIVTVALSKRFVVFTA